MQNTVRKTISVIPSPDTLEKAKNTNGHLKHVRLSNTLVSMVSMDEHTKFRAAVRSSCEAVKTGINITAYDLALLMICTPYYSVDHGTLRSVPRGTFVTLWSRMDTIASTYPTSNGFMMGRCCKDYNIVTTCHSNVKSPSLANDSQHVVKERRILNLNYGDTMEHDLGGTLLAKGPYRVISGRGVYPSIQHAILDQYNRYRALTVHMSNGECWKCGNMCVRAYATGGGSTISVCLACGVSDLLHTQNSYHIVIGRHKLCISGEHLLRPDRYVRQVLSTSASTLQALRRVERLYCGKELDWITPAKKMGAVRYTSDGCACMKSEVLYTCPVLHIASMILGGCFVTVLCPVPSVASSTVNIPETVRKIISLGGAWKSVTNTNTNPLSAAHVDDKVVGRDAETAVSINMPDGVVECSTIGTTTCMSKICAMVVGCNRVYGMSMESLAIFSEILVPLCDKNIWPLVLTEAIKVTMKHVSGCSIVFTYTGTISYTGSPTKIPVAISGFMGVLNTVFTAKGSKRILLAMKRVVKPVWTVSVRDIV